MAAPTLFRRLVVAQALGAFALLLVFSAVFYVKRNRAIARLTAERWAPALRAAAGLGPMPAAAPVPVDVRVSDQRPDDTLPGHAWAPRIATLRDTLRADGLPAQDVVFARGRSRPFTWISVTGADGRTRWLGICDEVVEPDVLWRLAIALTLGFAVVLAASWALARRLTQPLESLRRRIESHDARSIPDAVSPAPAGPTMEIAAIEGAFLSLADRLAHQESERALLLARVSHDMRSPLSRIRMAAELLPETADVAPRRASIVRNVDVADRLAASFLDYVRASELPLESTVDVVDVARRLVAQRDEPPEVLAIAAPAALPLPRTHALLLERLLANLVDNAMRHGGRPC